MKTTLQFIAISVLLGAMGGMPAVTSAELAEKTDVSQEATPPAPTTQDTAPTEPTEDTDSMVDDAENAENTDAEAGHAASMAKNLEGITLQHRVNAADASQPLKQIKADPLILLQTFKQDIMEIVQANSKPLKISSEIKLLLSESLSKQMGELPSVTVETTVDATGKGVSQVVFPAYQHVEPAADEIKKFTIDFKGLGTQLQFPEAFTTSSYHTDFLGLTLEEDNQYKLVLDKITSEGKFDTDFIPLKTFANLSKLEFNNTQEGFKVLIENGSSDTTLEKLKNAVEVQMGSLKLGKFELQHGDMQSKFDRLEANFGGTEQADTVNFFLNSKFNGAILPEEVIDESLTLHYSSQLELRHLMAESIVELQQVALNFEKQRIKGVISEDTMYLMLFSKFMEVAPKLAAKSPELALNDLSLKTNYGQLTGNTTFGIDGAKFKSLADFTSLVNALRMQSDLTISKKLLQKFLVTLSSESGIVDEKTDKKPSKEAIEKQAIAQAQTTIDDLLRDKWLVEQADNYRFVASLQANKFVVNGTEKPSPFSGFMEAELRPVIEK
jgi:hypothetical protein